MTEILDMSMVVKGPLLYPAKKPVDMQTLGRTLDIDKRIPGLTQDNTVIPEVLIKVTATVANVGCKIFVSVLFACAGCARALSPGYLGIGLRIWTHSFFL